MFVFTGLLLKVWHSEGQWLAWRSRCHSLYDRGSSQGSYWGLKSYSFSLFIILDLRQLQHIYFYFGCMAKLYSQATLNLLHIKVAMAISWVALAYGTVTLNRHSVGRLAMCLFPREARLKVLQIEVYKFVQNLLCVGIMHGPLRVKWTPFSFICNNLASNKSATKQT